MEDPYEQIGALLDQFHQAPEGPQQTEILREVIRHADVIGDRQHQFNFRAVFVQVAFASGHADEMLVALAWCLAKYDESPDEYATIDEIVDLMGCALAYITCFPSVSKQKIHELVDDFERRCSEAGTGIRRVCLQRTRLAFWMGDMDEAKRYYALFSQSRPKGGWSDEYERIFRVDYHVHVGDDESACEEADPVIQNSGSADGPEVWICAFILPSLVRLGRLQDAQRCHERGYKAARDNPKHLGLVANHIVYLLAIRDLEKAYELFTRHAIWAAETCSLETRYQFCTASWRLFEMLNLAGTGSVRIQLPQNLSPENGQTEHPTAELKTWFQLESKRIAEMFNSRNGNDWYTESIEQVMQLTAS